MSTNGISTTTVATAAVDSLPGAWYNLRIRIVGSQVRVWRRNDAGAWGTPVLSVASLPHLFASTSYAFTAHPTARYLVANFRVRAYEGPIDQNLGTIDTESLSLAVNMSDSAAVRPAGGSYPPGERVPVSVTAEPGFVFRQW